MFALIGSYHPVAHAGATTHGALSACAAGRARTMRRALAGRRTRNPLVRFQRGFEHRFERFRGGYRALLALALAARGVFIVGFLCCRARLVRACAVPRPELLSRRSMSDQIPLHVRAQTGTRIEETAALVRPDRDSRSARSFRRRRSTTIVDNIGLPISGINMAYSNTGTHRRRGRRYSDHAQAEEASSPTADYIKQLREELPRQFPGTTFAFLPADIGQPDPQFRPAGADRRAGHRPRTSRPTAPMPTRSSRTHRARSPGIADLAHPAGVQRADTSTSTSTARWRDTSASPNATSRTACRTRWPAACQSAPTFWLNPEERRLLSDRRPDRRNIGSTRLSI